MKSIDLKKIPFWISLLAVFTIVYDLGFNQTEFMNFVLKGIYLVNFLFAIVTIIVLYPFKNTRPKPKVWFFDVIYFGFIVFSIGILFGHQVPHFHHPNTWKYLTVIFIFIREFSILKINFSRQYFNPAQLFIFSFILIILGGMLLLLLPNATYTGLKPIDALFTSTSAVCVTGLSVVDTGTFFTTFGQVIIITLIQIGGIGIMTFTSYFSYFFRGGSSYENQLMLREMTNSEKIAEVFGTLKKILLLTFVIELGGAIIIFSSIDNALIPEVLDRAFFAGFHSISAFCNAGFSTLAHGFYDIEFRYNYSIMLCLSFLIIMGGIGFPILLNFLTYFKHLVINRIKTFGKKSRYQHKPWILNMNTRIVMLVTGILLLFGFSLVFILEFNTTLYEHDVFGKIVTAFFTSVAARTAGFNSVDLSALTFASTMIIIFLMWVGASPGGTGGGIKTTTFAIATLNFLSIAKGKDRIEIFGREISNSSVKRAFAAISLSLIVIGISIFFITIFDRDLGLQEISFECFSAYSTTGLSLGITDSLSTGSKIVIIICMFIGRVSMLSILIAIYRKVRFQKYRYPVEEILIN